MKVGLPIKNRIAEYYDRYAEVYDRKHGVILSGQQYNFKNYYEPFLCRALPPTGKILELGCGTGVFTRWLFDRGFSVIGMDISPEILKQARRRCPEVTFYEGDCEEPARYLDLSLAEEGFDAIVGINTFSYYPEKDRALSNYQKLLRPKGRLILIDMNGACPYYPVMAWINKNELREWLPQIKESNRGNLRVLLERRGFRIKDLEHFAFIPNGVGEKTVSFLRPFDRILELFPAVRPLAMRIALCAEKG